MIPDEELARLFSVPTRRRLFELVERSPSPVSVGELVDALECNHNTVRRHLARLREAGLVEEHVETRAERGRPRLLYTPGLRRDPYAQLARILAEVVRTKETPRTVGRRIGRREAERWRGTDVVDALVAEAGREGFAPRRAEHETGTDIMLATCPFADVAAFDPRTICSLHRGLAEGFVDGLGGARVDAFVAMDPYQAGCVVRVQRVPNPRLA
jgi:predicted ArsR family transcriptional regulator